MSPVHLLSDSEESDVELGRSEAISSSPPRKKPRLSHQPVALVYIIQQKMSDSEIEEIHSLLNICSVELALELKLTSSIEEAMVRNEPSCFLWWLQQ
jgi:hypothetical protein